MQIEALVGHDHLAATLAEWHVAEFGHLYDDEVWNGEIAVREMEQMATPRFDRRDAGRVSQLRSCGIRRRSI